MEKCLFCGADTQLFTNEKPVCLDCDEKISKKPERALTRASKGAVDLIDDVKPDKALGAPAAWIAAVLDSNPHYSACRVSALLNLPLATALVATQGSTGPISGQLLWHSPCTEYSRYHLCQQKRSHHSRWEEY
jgi:hypothetical protein